MSVRYCIAFIGVYIICCSVRINGQMILSDVDPSGGILRIYSYDANITNYYSNSNTSFNFNKYRTTYSTMLSGFGVFGSMNSIDINLSSDE